MNSLLLVILLIILLLIIIERKINYPIGMTWIVFCIIPPFIKRIRVYNKWIGFDKNWKFIFMKELD